MGKRGPKKKPTKILKIRGSWRGNVRKTEVKVPQKAPSPPAWLSGNAKREWQRVMKILSPLNIITELDRTILAAYCQCYADYVEALDHCKHGILIKTTSGNVIQNPAIGVKNTALKLLHKMATEFGMSPSARSQLETPPLLTKEEQKKERFFAKNA